LRFLQFAAVVRIDHLPLGKDIQAGKACLAVTIAGATSPSKGELNLCSRRAGIDVENARGDVAHGALHAVDVLRIDGAGETKGRLIIHHNRLIERTYLDDGERRAKDFLLCQAHLRMHIGEEGGTVEVASR
jgi:hypothetical protein